MYYYIIFPSNFYYIPIQHRNINNYHFHEGIGPDLANQYEEILLEDSRLDRRHLRRREEHSPYEMLRPGFARISLPYFMSDSEVGFILEAVKMVATEAWKLLPQYILNPEVNTLNFLL